MEEIQFTSVENFLLELKRELGREDNESTKVAELKNIEQEEKTMEKSVQEFRSTAREIQKKSTSRGV